MPYKCVYLEPESDSVLSLYTARMNTASRQKSGDVLGVCILEGATKFPPQTLCVASDLNVEYIPAGENRKGGGQELH